MITKIQVPGIVPYIGKVMRVLCSEHRYRVEVNVATDIAGAVRVSTTVIGKGARFNRIRELLNTTGWAYTFNDEAPRANTTDYRSFTVLATTVLDGNPPARI